MDSKDHRSLANRFKPILMMYTEGHLCLAVIIILLVSISSVPLSEAVTDKSELVKLISDNEDPLISMNDLAFLLVTHNFEAIPKKDYVEVRLDRTIYKLMPNGPYPGLANVTIGS
jgi:hypothetical protein